MVLISRSFWVPKIFASTVSSMETPLSFYWELIRASQERKREGGGRSNRLGVEWEAGAEVRSAKGFAWYDPAASSGAIVVGSDKNRSSSGRTPDSLCVRASVAR